MNLTKFKKICKYTVEIETDITVNDTVSKVLDIPPMYPMTTLWEKFEDYKNRVEKNSNSSRNKENLEYLKYLMRQRNIEIEEIPEEIEVEIIERNSQRVKKDSIYGIYGYFDIKKEIYIYIGKDSNIGINLRDMQHHANDSQRINRILRGDNEGRYEYRVIEIISENVSIKTLDIRERYWIAYYNTYHYENPEGMNFTRGGETTFGIETEAKIDRNKVYKKINRIYKGERDGKPQKHGVYTIGNDGDPFELTTNGGGDRGTQFAIKNNKKINNKKIHKKVLQSMNLANLIKRFQESFPNSDLLIKEEFKNKYNDILIEFGY